MEMVYIVGYASNMMYQLFVQRNENVFSIIYVYNNTYKYCEITEDEYINLIETSNYDENKKNIDNDDDLYDLIKHFTFTISDAINKFKKDIPTNSTYPLRYKVYGIDHIPYSTRDSISQLQIKNTLTIQKMWRGYISRKICNMRRMKKGINRLKKNWIYVSSNPYHEIGERVIMNRAIQACV